MDLLLVLIQMLHSEGHHGYPLWWTIYMSAQFWWRRLLQPCYAERGTEILGTCHPWSSHPLELASLFYMKIMAISASSRSYFCNQLNYGEGWLDYLYIYSWYKMGHTVDFFSNFVSVAPHLPTLNMTHYRSVQDFYFAILPDLNQPDNGLVS